MIRHSDRKLFLASTARSENPLKCWTQRGRKGLIRESFFLPARNRGLLRGGRMSEATDRPDRAKTADFKAELILSIE